MNKLSFSDQVHVFYNHDIILSPHGSALINVVFCIPHSVLIECNPPYFFEFWYINTASLSNVYYISVSSFYPNDKETKKWIEAERSYHNGTFEQIHRKYINTNIDPPLMQLKYAISDALDYITRWYFSYKPQREWSEVF